jgi:L-seryl-tRNA(Ser) seleniumtransferase
MRPTVPTVQWAQQQEVRIMVTKPSDLLGRLPTVNELLEKPPIRALADRLNRSVVASGVRSFLEELRSDLERRATDFELPSLRELAERAARHVAILQQSSHRPSINATGRFLGPNWSGTPLADVALERIVSLGRGYVSASPTSAAGDAAAALARLTGAEAATVVSSYSGAVWLALAAVAADRQVVIARHDVGELDAGTSLPAAAESARVKLREVGAVNRTSSADFESAIGDQTAAIVRHTSDFYHVAGDAKTVEVEALVGLARDRELPLVELLGASPLVDRLPAIDAESTSVVASIARGAHLVVCRGDGLVGGPRCGIVVGTRQLIRRIESQPMFAAGRADPATCAALRATLDLYGDPLQLAMGVPLFQLLSASVENLRQRAERLAPQLAQAVDVESAIPVPTESCLGLAHLQRDTMPSYAIALSPIGGDARTLEARLQKSCVPIYCRQDVGRQDGERLLVDLRTVLPRQDQCLVEMVAAPPISAEKQSGEVPVVTTV